MVIEVEQVPSTVTKEGIVTTIVDNPVIEKIIEKKDVQVHHKNIVQEIHEQPIIEVERVHEVKKIQDPIETKTIKKFPAEHELIEQEMNDDEILELQRAKGLINIETKVKTQTTVVTHNDEAELRQIIEQPIIEPHVQPVITEIHRKKIIIEHEHPIIRKIRHPPLVRVVYKE
jgi:hypothetical protein